MKCIDIFKKKYHCDLEITPQPAQGTYRALLDAAKQLAVAKYGWSDAYAEAVCRHGVITRVAHSRLSNEEKIENFYAERPTFALWRNLCQVAREMNNELGGMKDYVPSA